MKVAIEISLLQDKQHKVRGVGSYIANLQKGLENTPTSLSFQFFTSDSTLDKDVDLIHYPYFDPFRKLELVHKNIKTVITIHDLTPIILKNKFPVGFRGSINWQINKINLRKLAGIITDSESSKKDIIRLAGVASEKVQAIHLAAGEEFKQIEGDTWQVGIREKYRLPDRFALYVGDVTPNKNLPRLIEAVKKTNIPCVLVGKALASSDFDKDHPWNRDVAAVQEMIKDDKQFILPGFVSNSDLVALYNLATIFVMPSLYEGFGLPVLEAMQSGCPVITSGEGSLKEVAGQSAIFVNPRDVEDMVGKIKIITEDIDMQKKYAILGLRQAEKFSWHKTAKETVSVYEKILSAEK